MESPVRICLGAALVVSILLLCNAPLNNAQSYETSTSAVKDVKTSKYQRLNFTRFTRNKPKTVDVALNELNPKTVVSEENTEKNAKYKHRGRVKFSSPLKLSSESPLRRIRSTEAPQTNAKNASESLVTNKTNKATVANLSLDINKGSDSEALKHEATETISAIVATPEANKPEVNTNSVGILKHTQILSVNISTSSPLKSESSSEEEYEENDEEENESFERYTKNSFSDSDFSSFPGLEKNSFSPDYNREASESKSHRDYSRPSFDLGFFSDVDSYASKEHETFKFDFTGDLTTPRNDFFDKRFKQISNSIKKNLASIAKTTSPINSTVQTIVKEKLNNSTPGNTSTLLIKNTKEIRLLDNDKAGSANNELSDVHGTSIYYARSVLSTETYNINQSNGDDCDETTPEPTRSTPVERAFLTSSPETLLESKLKTISLTKNIKADSSHAPDLFSFTSPMPDMASIKSPSETILEGELTAKSIENNIKAESSYAPTLLTFTSSTPDMALLKTSPETILESKSKSIENNILAESSHAPTLFSFTSPTPEIYNPSTSIAVSTQNSVSSTEKPNVFLSSSSPRSRNYQKRLNFTSNKDTHNGVTVRPETHSHPPFSRKIYFSPPKSKPVWMAPSRNANRTYVRPSTPATIYSEHFNIRDKIRTKPKFNRTFLSSSLISADNINPVLQTDISGIKKNVYTPSTLDNSIPALWKRGSTKFSPSSTTTSSETDSNISGMEIPLTLNAWALASSIIPPSSLHNVSKQSSTQKSIDENELKNENDSLDDKEVPETTTTTAISSTSKIYSDIAPNKISWKPDLSTPLISTEESEEETDYAKDYVSVENTSSKEALTHPSSGKPIREELNELVDKAKDYSVYLSSETSEEKSTTEQADKSSNHAGKTNQNTDALSIAPVKTTVSTSFESITKLPSSVMPPSDDYMLDRNRISTTTTINANNYDITTIRFSYVPTEATRPSTESEKTTSGWKSIIPTRTKRPSTKWSYTTGVLTTAVPATTYRPSYTTSESEKITNFVPSETIPSAEVSLQVVENITSIPETTTEAIVATIGTNYNNLIEPITEQTIEPATKPATEPTTEPATEPATETATESATELVTEPATEPATVPSIESSTKTSTEITTESAKKLATEPATEITTKLFNIVTITTSSSPQKEIEKTLVPVETTSKDAEETTRVTFEVVTEINTESYKSKRPTTEKVSTIESVKTLPNEYRDSSSSESSGSNEVITQVTTKPQETTTLTETTRLLNTIQPQEVTILTVTTKEVTETVTELKYVTTEDVTVETTTYGKSVSDQDSTSYLGDHTTERSHISPDTGSGAAVAIAVSTIGVIALILLIGLLMVVRRRGRRGVYAQRCTPVSLDAYSLDSVSVGHRKGNQRLRASKRSYGNPAYDDEVTSHPMQYAALASFAMDVESIITEWSEIPSVTVRPDDVPPGCEDKNRYSNVLPLPETRVQLSRIGNDPTTEYINANFITGPGNIRNYYIACQAPLSNTVVDFWRMIWEQNSRVIVMLTEYMENGVEKCYEYLPPSEITDNKRTFGDFQIILKKREQRDKYAISSVQLINLVTRTWRELTHLWYFWPAKGVPEDYDSVIDFLSEMRSYMKVMQAAKEYDEDGVEIVYSDQRGNYQNLSKFRQEGSGNGVNVYSPAKAEEQMKKGNGTLGRMKNATESEGVRPCTVVCASGAGRAAALVGLDVCARALAAGRADVPRVVRELRAQRPHALANKHHYIFLYKVLSEYGNKLMGGGGVDNL